MIDDQTANGLLVSGFWVIVGLGALGGTAVEFLRWWKLRESKNLPIYAGSAFYWAMTIGMIVLGGFVAALYGSVDRNPIAVVQLGASAPTLIAAFSAPKSKRPPAILGESKAVAPTRDFLAFRG